MSQNGIIYAATGPDYTTLARRAARALRKVMPDTPVDLFTDQPIRDSLFDHIHPLDHAANRPKMEAMRRSRFDRTLYLDADTLVLANVSDVFDVLGTADIAAALGANRTPLMMPENSPLPRALPVVNSGVMALRRSEATAAFMADWETEMTARGDRIDQRVLRDLIWTRPGIRFVPLPEEYNLKTLSRLDVWTADMGAPRILHQSALHAAEPGNPEDPLSLDEVLNWSRADHVRALLASDWSLGGTGDKVDTPENRRRTALRRFQRKARSQ